VRLFSDVFCTLHKKPCRIGSGLCGTSENAHKAKFAVLLRGEVRRMPILGTRVTKRLGTALGSVYAWKIGCSLVRQRSHWTLPARVCPARWTVIFIGHPCRVNPQLSQCG
jgi:hypothetical protein